MVSFLGPDLVFRPGRLHDRQMSIGPAAHPVCVLTVTLRLQDLGPQHQEPILST
jgi:hypothetical protein